tara:strand:- start:615 stop:1322 length:708 start_codon:yes stop_codon:yes gene_type:complete
MAYAKRNATLPEHLSKLIVACGLDPAIDKGSVWNCHGTPVILHAALERIADHVNIVFQPPQIIEAQSQAKIAVVCVSGSMDALTAWSIGEATPANNKNEYPWAMAEKRAKDRVILKLIGASGFVYSEEEADSLKQAGGNYIPPEKEPAPTPRPAPSGAKPPASAQKSDEPDEWEALLREIDVKMKNTKTHKDLLDFMNGGYFKDRMAAMQAADPHKYNIARDILVRMNTKLKPQG